MKDIFRCVLFLIFVVSIAVFAQNLDSEKTKSSSVALSSGTYEYNALVTSIFDGDTCTVRIDLGLGVTVVKKIRLLGIDTPEMRGDDKANGKIARDYVRSLILNKDIIVRTNKDKTGKYGRLLAVIFIKKDGKLIDLNQLLIDEGYAVKYGK